MSRLVARIRRLREDPLSTMKAVGVSPRMKVADIGAGYGYYAIPAASIVGKEGVVYAVEPDRERAKEIAQVAEEESLSNVVVITASAEQMTEIPAATVDMAIAMSSVHHFADLEKALSEIERIVRPGGAVYIRDLKAGRVFRHGSKSGEFRMVVGLRFPQTEFTETSGHIVARIAIPPS